MLTANRWSHAFYEHLTRTDPVRPADLILVMAGRMERKRYGIDLYRQGVAPHLLLSVGRFEVSKMQNLDLPELDLAELMTMRDQTPPGDRHFFIEVGPHGVQLQKAALRPWNTYGEAVGLRRWLRSEPEAHVLVISTDVHLRRVALTFGKVFADMPVKFSFCPVPPGLTFLRPDAWWLRADERRFVLKEAAKLAGYRLILSMPAPLSRGLMGVRAWLH